MAQRVSVSCQPPRLFRACLEFREVKLRSFKDNKSLRNCNNLISHFFHSPFSFPPSFCLGFLEIRSICLNVKTNLYTISHNFRSIEILGCGCRLCLTVKLCSFVDIILAKIIYTRRLAPFSTFLCCPRRFRLSLWMTFELMIYLLFWFMLYIVSFFSYDLILLRILKMVTLGDFCMCVMKDAHIIKLAYRDRRFACTFNLGVRHCPFLALNFWVSFACSLSYSFQRMG